MKKYVLSSCLLMLASFSFSFVPLPGGDVFEIYLNGRRVHQQFVHANEGVKTLHLSPLKKDDKIEVLYSHCGQPGTNRMLTFRTEKNKVVKSLSFQNTADKRSLMPIQYREVAPIASGKLHLYYTSQEIPQGKLLAIMNWGETNSTARLATGREEQ